MQDGAAVPACLMCPLTNDSTNKSQWPRRSYKNFQLRNLGGCTVRNLDDCARDTYDFADAYTQPNLIHGLTSGRKSSATAC